LPLLSTEVLQVFRGHRTIVPQGNDRDIPGSIRLDAKALLASGLTKLLLKLPRFVLVLGTEFSLLSIELLFTKGFGECFSEVANQALHVLTQSIALSRL
jgi:hypothetical protein